MKPRSIRDVLAMRTVVDLRSLDVVTFRLFVARAQKRKWISALKPAHGKFEAVHRIEEVGAFGLEVWVRRVQGRAGHPVIE